MAKHTAGWLSATLIMPDANRMPPISRRDFGRCCATTAAALLSAGARTEQSALGQYVDVHTHLGKTWNTTAELTVDQLLSWMDANEIAQAVVLPNLRCSFCLSPAWNGLGGPLTKTICGVAP